MVRTMAQWFRCATWYGSSAPSPRSITSASRFARGEIFGLLGPNGAGKTTTFRMLCGLLPATSGTLRVAGMDLRRARASARQRIGYVAQKFSLYGQLSVAENLEFFASAYNLRGDRKQERIDWALHQFALDSVYRFAERQFARRF